MLIYFLDYLIYLFVYLFVYLFIYLFPFFLFQQPVATSEQLPIGKTNENEFTLDKQQDFQKLLEGSTYLSGYKSIHENWKDRLVPFITVLHSRPL